MNDRAGVEEGTTQYPEQLVIDGIQPFETYTPSWATVENGYETVPELIRINGDVARVVIGQLLREENPVHLADKGNGQKKYDPNGYTNLAGYKNQHKEGVVFLGRDGVNTWRHPFWWSEEDHMMYDRNPDLFPNYAHSSIPVVKRDIDVERSIVPADEVPLGSSGNELEFQAVAFGEDDEPIPVNVQDFLKVFSDPEIFQDSKFPISLEGWASQLELISIPRMGDESPEVYHQRMRDNLRFVSKALNRMGVYLMPTGVMPTNSDFQANFEDPHVEHVLRRGQSGGEELVSVKEAARQLEGFGASGTHITVDVYKKDGVVGDEVLQQIFTHTHGKALLLMKAFSLSGNMGSVESLANNYPGRELTRKELSTARVGPVRRLLDETTIHAFTQNGRQPSLERAALCDSEGREGWGAHNPLGRMKESGRNEFTIFDVVADTQLLVELESALNLYTTAVHKALLRDVNSDNSLENIKLQLSEYHPNYAEFFLGLMTNQDEFDELASEVDKFGFDGKVVFVGNDVRIGEVVNQFIDFIGRLALDQNIDSPDDYENLSRLKARIHDEYDTLPESFEDLLRIDSTEVSQGSIAYVAHRQFLRLVEEGVEAEMARRFVVKKYAEVYSEYLSVA